MHRSRRGGAITRVLDREPTARASQPRAARVTLRRANTHPFTPGMTAVCQSAYLSLDYLAFPTMSFASNTRFADNQSRVAAIIPVIAMRSDEISNKEIPMKINTKVKAGSRNAAACDR